MRTENVSSQDHHKDLATNQNLAYNRANNILSPLPPSILSCPLDFTLFIKWKFH